MSEPLVSLKWERGALVLLDQTGLPDKLSYIRCTDYREVGKAIFRLSVRGAPAIGVAAAYAMVLAYQEIEKTVPKEQQKKAFLSAGRELISSRPTAVNLSWAVHEMIRTWESLPNENKLEGLTTRARAIEEEDKNLCSRMADHGADLFKGRKNLRILTHCNTGALATAGIGTAFGVIYRLYERGQIERVYADETRPLLQGARLTGTELMVNHIPCSLISDNMAGWVMKEKHIDAVIVGADRIAANGDAANKVGTYSLAVLCAYHHIPFYITAPFSTFDFSISSGDEIRIEERNPEEVRQIKGVYTAPKDIPVFNPAFDVAPHSLITGIITEKGVLTPPYDVAIKEYERSLH
ncbi:S-methyl-5-thioribose-1-phosphate isomerase [uncultured Dialister sp.]|uniref:S-methyl-5-thioribose-1-phosphate isomerase n=1 Tax=uncultured Dialister sp. TaxID=278064 RepID=UPI002620EA6C|nr:S-methyl-5-thioribose-1-phosphate isomerase [uncultured Dialister sp.]